MTQKNRHGISNLESRISDFRFSIRNPKSEIRNLQGFTLVEMMLVVVIIGVLAAMVVPRLASRPQQAKIARAKADLGVIGQSIDLFHFDMDGYPEQLQDLVTRPSGDTEERWSGPYLKGGVPKDPWGRLYVFNKKASEGNPDYELYSLGPDGQPGNDDVKLE